MNRERLLSKTKETACNVAVAGIGLGVMSASAFGLLYLAQWSNGELDMRDASASGEIKVGQKAFLMKDVTVRFSGRPAVRIEPIMATGVWNYWGVGTEWVLSKSPQNPLFLPARNPNNDQHNEGWIAFQPGKTSHFAYVGYSETQKSMIQLSGSSGEVLNPPQTSPRQDVEHMKEVGLLVPVTITSIDSLQVVDQNGVIYTKKD